MKEQIYTIPISEAFAAGCGCPICALYRKTDAASVEYIVGAAMMETHVRAETNRYGFCSRHFAAMLGHKNRLSVALTLESHLGEVAERNFNEKALSAKALLSPVANAEKVWGALREQTGSCYVCRRNEEIMGHYYENIAFLWKKEEEFRRRCAEQEYYCLPHLARLVEYGKKQLSKKELPLFATELYAVSAAYGARLHGDLKDFCNSFDYREAGKALSEAQKTSIERTELFINGIEPAR